MGCMMPRLQSAMEYLMTYGWAILAIAIVMVSLYSLGIFNTGNLQPTAIPGSCEIVRTAAQTSLAGQCSNLIPKYVGQFNGQNSYIDIFGSAGMNGYSKLTLAAWINTYSYIGFPFIIVKGSNGPYQFYLYSSSNHPGWYLNGKITDTPFNGTVNTNSWYFVAVTYDSSSGQTVSYLNGHVDKIITGLSGQISTNGANVSIGGYVGGVGSWNGLISNIQVYNTSLSASDILSLYDEGIGGEPVNFQSLLGWWPLNGNANDYSGNNNQGTATRIVWNANWQSGYSSPSS
ncbi:MAG: LamG domain-containing protein [Candidatus Micrarchaeota archaeon]|nr:LamG domain-containing protein [Candidatus Micrarchaeota archaeon]